MKIQYNEKKDKRINARRSFFKQFLIIWGVVVICGSGLVLIYNHQLFAHNSPWMISLAGSSYVFFIGFVISYVVRIVSYSWFFKPINEISRAARKVAGGDFTVRVRPQRKDGKKDELEVLIDDFNKMTEELSTVEILKSDFIANVSHEMKTPLAIIQGYASALRDDKLPNEEKEEYVETIIDTSKKLSQLVTNVLRLNKLEIQEIIDSNHYSLDEQIRCCIVALEDKFNEKNIEIYIDLDEVTFDSDEGLLEIVWNNLLTNAIKFTNPNGSVSVELKKYDEGVVVIISDTGCGMSEETVRHIFDRFYQGDTSRSKEGNGLGLSLTKRVVELVGGAIEVNSVPGKGTTFKVTLI